MDVNLTVNVVYLALVAFFGLPGNCIIVAVFSQQVPKTATTILILALAADDLFMCLLILLIIYYTIRTSAKLDSLSSRKRDKQKKNTE